MLVSDDAVVEVVIVVVVVSVDAESQISSVLSSKPGLASCRTRARAG